MASGSYPATVDKRAQFIERQLDTTRRQVKLVELSAACVTLGVGLMAYLFLMALVDHWLLPLGFWGRLAALATLIGGAAWYLVAVVWPLLRNSINPAYAARAIEQSTPTLKNSLINFLMLRADRGGVHDVVYEAVEARAASDLSQVPLDTVVDYSRLIKVGYVLAGVFAICAAYKILSPKDPLQTIARVAVPWADIDRPSRVQIEDVTPGDTEQTFGDTLTIRATIRGLRTTDRVQVVYSTADGQTTNQTVPMTVDDSGLVHSARLPADGQGVQQNLTYHLEAGDAVTRDFQMQVV
ncbi:MAG TPA: hypothetical protein VL096_06580, partial [Pirellulaceae bacterium]|nr:hypothetical protein [Pirellulaceae bacterium]